MIAKDNVRFKMRNNTKKRGFYEKYIKRPLDFCISSVALVVLSPFLLIFVIVGAVKMQGNPFFVQERPGKDGKIFKLVKLRSMNNKKDENGQLLPDEVRLTRYGRVLRKSSIDELPELWNIVKGDMSIVGPRPLLVRYLPRYNAHQARRHEVRPGITGLAQINGRNAISWEEKFDWDVRYVDDITFLGDLKIIFKTAATVLKREGISAAGEATMGEFMGNQENIK